MKHIENKSEIRSGKTIFYQSWLPDRKSTAIILLVHGFGEHSGRYSTHFASFFTNNQIGIATFDLPGHGKSYGKRGHIDDPLILLEIITDLVNRLKNENPEMPIFIYGHSFGGEVSLWYSLVNSNTVRGYIITSPLIGTKEEVPAGKLIMAKIMDNIMPSFTMDNGIEVQKLSRDSQIVNAYESDPLVHRNISAKTGMMIINRGKWIMENASNNTNDTLLMIGNQEEIVNPEAVKQFQELAPKVTYKVWEGLYHELHNEPEKEDVLLFILDWINKHSGK